MGRWFPDFTVGQQIIFVILMEHVFLTMKFVISRAIPDVPAWVVLASAKEKYKREQVRVPPPQSYYHLICIMLLRKVIITCITYNAPPQSYYPRMLTNLHQALRGLEKLMRTTKLRGQIRKKVDAVRSKLEDMQATDQKAEEAAKKAEESKTAGISGAGSRYKVE